MDLSRFPRRRYTAGPTAIEPLPQLSAALNGNVNIFIKRDDQLGLTGGGNKTRKLEFVMADVLAQQDDDGNNKIDTVITCGAVQSNHCRLTAAACNKEGLACCLVVEERVPGSYSDHASGNHYLFRLLGVEQIIVVGLGEAAAAVEQLAEQLRAQGRNVYVIPGGASNELGALGYCACAAEIQHQQFIGSPDNTIPDQFDCIVTASGSGGTHAGLVAGLQALRSPVPVLGISTRHPRDHQTAHIAQLAQRVLKFMDVDVELPQDAVVVMDNYVGDGYSLPTKAMQEAVTLFARTEGILLDPVYTGKAAAGLIDLVRRGYFAPGSNVLFLHTGGAPSLYHYQPILMEEDGVVGVGSTAGKKQSIGLDQKEEEEKKTAY